MYESRIVPPCRCTTMCKHVYLCTPKIRLISLGHATSCLLSIARYFIVRYGQESKIINLTRLLSIIIQLLMMIYIVGVKAIDMNYHLDADTLIKEVSFDPLVLSLVYTLFSNLRYAFLENLTIRRALC